MLLAHSISVNTYSCWLIHTLGFCRCWCQPTRLQARRRGPTCPRWGRWGCSGRSSSCPESQVGHLFFWTRKLSKNRNSLDTVSLCQRRKTFDKDLDTIYDSSQTSISRSPDRNSMSPLSGGTQFTSLVEVLLITALSQQQSAYLVWMSIAL